MRERWRDSTHVCVSLKGLKDAEYVKDIFRDLEYILRDGQEGIWCYGASSFIDVSIFPRSPTLQSLTPL